MGPLNKWCVAAAAAAAENSLWSRTPEQVKRNSIISSGPCVKKRQERTPDRDPVHDVMRHVDTWQTIVLLGDDLFIYIC